MEAALTVHCQLDPGDGGGLHLEVHPAPVDAPVLGPQPLQDEAAGGPLEEGPALQGGVIGPVTGLGEAAVWGWRNEVRRPGLEYLPLRSTV